MHSNLVRLRPARTKYSYHTVRSDVLDYHNQSFPDGQGRAMLKDRASLSVPLSCFHPLVQKWFSQRFVGVTEPQHLGWPGIQSGEDVLISAPTGSGKTLAAFLHALDQLVRSASGGELADETRILYV